jgi:hypothetical protein
LPESKWIGIITTTAIAQKVSPTKDALETKDYPGLPRNVGSTILIQSQQKFGELGLRIVVLSTLASADPKEARLVESHTHRTSYLLLNLGAGKRSTLEIVCNYQQAFK